MAKTGFNWDEYNRWVSGLAIEHYQKLVSKGEESLDAMRKVQEWIAKLELDPLKFAEYNVITSAMAKRIHSVIQTYGVIKGKWRIDKHAVITAILAAIAGLAVGFFVWG